MYFVHISPIFSCCVTNVVQNRYPFGLTNATKMEFFDLCTLCVGEEFLGNKWAAKIVSILICTCLFHDCLQRSFFTKVKASVMISAMLTQLDKITYIK